MEENKENITENAEAKSKKKLLLIIPVVIAAIAVIGMIIVLVYLDRGDDTPPEEVPGKTDYVNEARNLCRDGKTDEALALLKEQIDLMEKEGIEDEEASVNIVMEYSGILKSCGEDTLSECILLDLKELIPGLEVKKTDVINGPLDDNRYIFGTYPTTEIPKEYVTYAVENASYGENNIAVVGENSYYRLTGEENRYFLMEKIIWLVMKQSNTEVVLLADSVIDSAPYNEKYESTGWNIASLRTYMNDDFLNLAFDEDEQNQLVPMDIVPVRNPDYGVVTGDYLNELVTIPSIDDLVDGVYSIKEGRKEESSLRSSTATDYAVAKGTHLDTSKKCKWWTRTCGVKDNMGSFVGPNGIISCDGYYVNGTDIGVKPMITVKSNKE